MTKNILHTIAAALVFTIVSDLSANNYPPVKKLRSENSTTSFQIGAGMIGSVLYLSRNVKEDNDALGYTFMANYGGHKSYRVSIQYTFYKPLDIAPTWYNIHANSLESNIEVQARFKNNKSFLYPFTGLSYNTFSGYFTGRNDYLNLKQQFKVNEVATEKWVGLNLGTAFEHHMGPFVLFVDYRMRVGKTDNSRNSLNIMDICYSGGVRYKFNVPTIKKIYRGLTDKYTWF